MNRKDVEMKVGYREKGVNRCDEFENRRKGSNRVREIDR